VLLPTCRIAARPANSGVLAGSLLITGASQLLTLRRARSAKGQFPFQLRDHREMARCCARWRDRAVGNARGGRGAAGGARRGEIEPGRTRGASGFVDSHTHLIHAASRAKNTS